MNIIICHNNTSWGCYRLWMLSGASLYNNNNILFKYDWDDLPENTRESPGWLVDVAVCLLQSNNNTKYCQLYCYYYYGGGYACDSEPATTWQRVVIRRRRCVWPGAELKNAERVHRVRGGLSSSSRRFLAAHFHPARQSTIANHVRSRPTPPRGLIIFFLFGGT